MQRGPFQLAPLPGQPHEQPWPRLQPLYEAPMDALCRVLASTVKQCRHALSLEGGLDYLDYGLG